MPHAVLPDVVDLSAQCPPVYNQGQLGSCTANSVASAFDFERKAQGLSFITPSRLFLYYNTRDIEGTVDYDSGASLRDTIRSVVKQGVCPEIDWPYDISKFTEQPPFDTYLTAEKNQALEYRRIAPSETEMMQCLALVKRPFVFGFSVFGFFETPEMESTGILRLPDDSERSPIGGHAVKCVGYDRIKRLFKIKNSYGAAWGPFGGFFYIPFDYAANPGLADDRWIITRVEN